MMQDRDGYIWIGTYYGLNRYNGYSIDFFTENAKNPKAMINKVVYSLQEDKEGYIWVGTVAGLDRFDKRTETFEHISNDTSLNNDKEKTHKGLSNWDVRVVKTDKNGNVWVGTNKGGVNKVDPKTRKVTYFKRGFGAPDKIGSNIINDLIVDRKNRLWIATEGGGLSCMNLDHNTVKTFKHSETNSKSIPSDKISCLFEDRDGQIWLGDFEGNLVLFDETNNQFRTVNFWPNHIKPIKLTIHDLDQDYEGNLQIATMGAGLIVFNPKTGDSKINIHHFKDPGTIISNEAYSLLVDRTGTVFVGTYGFGISRYSPVNRKFPVYFMPASDIEGDKNAYTDCIEDDYGRLIIGTYHGFLVYDRKNNTYQHYLPGSSYEDNKILTITKDPDGGIWFGSNRSLHRYDKDLHKVKSYVVLKDNVDHPIYSIYFDHQQNLWFGLFVAEGLFKVKAEDWKNKTSNALKYRIYRNSSDSTSITGDQIWCIKQSKDNKLWIADNQGVCYYNYDKDNFSRVPITQMPKTITFDHNDNLWITTRGEGVYFYNPKTGVKKQYTTNEGLCENFVFGALVDKGGDVWFNTENGLSRFVSNSSIFRNYDIYDGLPNNRFDDRSEKMLSSGEIYMGTAQGFVIFDPAKITDDTIKPNVVLTDIKILNKSVVTSPYTPSSMLNAPIGKVSRLELNPSQRDFAIEFAALDYGAPHKILYAYKLDGFDNDWIYTDAKNRSARYTNLDGGEYNFLVMATNSDGVWNDKALKVKIIIHPPFYKTAWFRVLVFFAAILLIIIAFTLRIITEIKQKQKLSRLVTERTSELSEKNEMLRQTAADLGETNTLLEERQQFIEEQKEELAAHRDELAKLNTQKDKLFSIIAHDLKNPFNVIMGYTDLLLINNNNYDAEKRQKFLTYLQQASHNAYLLLENLLQWSRSQSGTLAYDPIPLKIDKLIIFTVKQAADLAENKGIDIVFEQTYKEVMVHADENMVNTILRNLLTNAIKFSHSGGIILVHLTKNETHAQISISDKGVGMTKEVKDNLFLLNKAHSSDGTAGEKGTGLGMILCKEFIDIHKGQIWVESELNKGTTFIFTLPLEN